MSILTDESEILLFNSLKGLHLLERTDKMTVLDDLIGIQSQFYSYAQNSLIIRADDYVGDGRNDGIVKIWSHRGTMHLVSERKLALHLAAAGYPREFVDGAWNIAKKDADKWAPFIVSEIEKGNTLREGLKEACIAKGMPDGVLDRVFYGWGGLIYEMTYRGMIAGVPGNQKEYLVPHITKSWPTMEEAREEMIRTYFKQYGPATVADCKYFFGRWKASDINHIIERVLRDMYETVIGGKKYYSAKKPELNGEIPECVLVPGFDQLVMGYKDRSRMIDSEHLKKLTNVAGIVFPSVIVRNKMRARWKYDNNVITVTPFEKLLKKDEAPIRRKAKEVFGKQTEIRFDTQAAD